MSAEVVDTATLRATDVLADDALLDALGGRDDQADALIDDDLNALLLAFRADADQPAPELVSTRRALSAIRRARWTARVSRFLACLTRRTR